MMENKNQCIAESIFYYLDSMQTYAVKIDQVENLTDNDGKIQRLNEEIYRELCSMQDRISHIDIDRNILSYENYLFKIDRKKLSDMMGEILLNLNNNLLRLMRSDDNHELQESIRKVKKLFNDLDVELMKGDCKHVDCLC